MKGPNSGSKRSIQTDPQATYLAFLSPLFDVLELRVNISSVSSFPEHDAYLFHRLAVAQTALNAWLLRLIEVRDLSSFVPVCPAVEKSDVWL